MWPNLKDVARTLAAAPLILLLYLESHNEYLFAPGIVDIVVGVVAAAGIVARIVLRRRVHAPFWMVFVLFLYNLPIWLGGFVFRPWTSLLVLAPCAALGWVLLRKRAWPDRVAMGLILWFTFGFFLLHYDRHMDFDDTFGRCKAEDARLDPLVKVIDREKHPYDFVHYLPPPDAPAGLRSREWIVGAYGITRLLRWFDPDTERWVRNTTLSGSQQIQRMAISPDGRYVLGASWGNRGHVEAIAAVEPGDPVPGTLFPIENCRNLYEIMTDPTSGRVFVLCEVSHSLSVLDGKTYQALGRVVLPGRDSYDLAIDTERRRVFVTDYWSRDVFVVNADTLALEGAVRVGWSSFGAVTYHDRLYVARPLAGEVVEVDLATLRVLRRIDVGYGPRDMEVDARRNLLYVGNYFDGTLDAIDLSTGKRRARLFVGRMLRGLMIDTLRDRLYIACACGARTVELSQWLPGPIAAPETTLPACVQGGDTEK